MYSPLETVTENIIRLTNAAITEVPFEEYCPATNKIHDFVQCESCKVCITFCILIIQYYNLVNP